MNTEQVPYQVLADFKRRFPEVSEQCIVETISQYSGNIQQVTKELKKKSDLLMYGENSSEFPQNQFSMTSSMTPSKNTMKNNFDRSYSLQFDRNNINMHEPGVPSGPTGSSGDFSRELPVVPSAADVIGYQTNNDANTKKAQSPADLFLQRRTISDDCLSYRKQMRDIKRERSASDISDFKNTMDLNKIGNSFVPPIVQNIGYGWQTPPERIIAKGVVYDEAMQNNNSQSLRLEKNRISQNIQLQIESCTRMQSKVDALRSDVERIRLQVMQEEDDIDASSKVQRNPTEKDVSKLNKEIEVLKRELIEADTALEKIKAGGSELVAGGAASPTSSILPSLQRIGSEELISTIQPAIRPHFNTNEGSVPHPHMSAARFPHSSYLNHLFTTSTPTSSAEAVFNPPRVETPPPDYSTLVNPIPEITDDQWECPACTFKNHAELPECEVCSHQRGH